MDTELKQHLEGMEARLRAHSETTDARVSGLKQDLEATEARLMAHVEATEGRLMAHVEATEARLRSHTSEECEKVETKLLTAFHKWGSTSDVRTRQALENVMALNERMIVLEDRVTGLERRPV